MSAGWFQFRRSTSNDDIASTTSKTNNVTKATVLSIDYNKALDDGSVFLR